MTPCLGSINLLAQLTELKETPMFTSLLKIMIKHTDEELHRVRSGRVPSSGASVPLDLGVYHPCCVDVVTKLEAL